MIATDPRRKMPTPGPNNKAMRKDVSESGVFPELNPIQVNALPVRIRAAARLNLEPIFQKPK